MPERARNRSATPRLRKATNLGYAVYFTKRDVTIPSGEVQSLLRHYNFGSAALYKIGINLRKMGVAEETVQETERQVYIEILKPLQIDLASQIAKLERRFGSPKPIAESSKPFTATVEIQYAKANILLDLLLSYDKLLFHVEQLAHDYKVVGDDFNYEFKMGDAEYVQIKRTFGERLKDSLIHIDHLARGAMQKATQLARKEQEDAEVEAGVKAMENDAAAAEAPATTFRPVARRVRKASEVVSLAQESPEQDQGKTGPAVEVAVEASEGRPVSPFEHVQ